MIAQQLISEEINPLRTSDTGLEALNWMSYYKISHLPIVNDQEFLGLISEEDIYNLNNPGDPIGNHKLSLFRPYVYYNQHIYEVLQTASGLKLSVVPVIDEENLYLGLITMVELMHQFAKLTAVDSTGGIIVLEIHQNEYSLSEISQIVESNDSKILSFYITTRSESVMMELTLKVNVSDITSIIQTFKRFNYEVKASYQEVDKNDDLMNSRYELLMKYLNI
jgi:signal-transduction protein with cAMP-binding, CBS, and nucleotidyltransferase domain